MAPKSISSSQPFVNALNVPLANGSLTFDLSQTANIIGNGSVVPRRVSVSLDSTGKCPTTAIWFNDQLLPAGTSYLLQAFDSGGNFAGNLGQVSLSGASPLDLSTLIPVAISGGIVSISNPVVTTPPGNQTITSGNLTLGAGNLSVVGNETVTGTLSAGSTLSKRLNGVRYVDPTNVNGWAGADAGAWINSAIADLGSTGGVVELQVGSYACTTAIIINVPLILRGQGTLATHDNVFTDGSNVYSCVLQNNSLSSDLITISLPAANNFSGVTLKDFAIRGNRNVGSATAGSNIRFLGGSGATVMRNMLVENVVSTWAFDNGIRVSNNVFMLDIISCGCFRNNKEGILIDASTSGPSQIRLYGTDSDLNNSHGMRIGTTGGASGGDIYIYGGTFADSTGDGIHLDNGTTFSLQAFGAHFESNSVNGINILGNTAHGLWGCYFVNNTTNDINLSSVGQGFSSSMCRIEGCAFNSSPSNSNINIAASCNNTIVGEQASTGGTNLPVVKDLGFNTQRHDVQVFVYNYSASSQGSFLNTSVQPFIGLQDSTGAQATPNKYFQSKGGILQINDSTNNNALLTLNDLSATSAGGMLTLRSGAAMGGQASIITTSGAINTAETLIVKSAAMPANRFVVGTVLYIVLEGTCTATVANTSTFRVRIGTLGTTGDGLMMSATTAASAASGTAIPFTAIFRITIQTVGASSTQAGTLTLLTTGGTSTGISIVPVQIISGSSTAFNTTTANLIISATYQSAATTTTSTFQQAYIEFPFQ